MRISRLLSASALTVAMLATPLVLAPVRPADAQIGIGLSITVAPPALPIYVQPPLPAPGYLWTPGYWDYAQEGGYYWVPGTWVEPPQPGLLWTPGYWGFVNGIYAFNRGYWGPHVGFYGGINYGFGYGGFGFEGGEWRGGVFAYNRAVNNFGGVHVTNVYNRTVINNTVNRVSFNGPNGVNVHPRPEEAAYAREAHVQPTAMQMQHQQAAAQNPALRASVNHGTPAIAATARPGEFHGPGVVPGRGAGTPMARPAEAAKTSEPVRSNTAANPAGMGHPALRSPGASTHVGTPMSRPTGAPHAMSPTHAEGAPRPAGMARPMAAPGGMAGPRPMAAPHPMGAPHPMAAPHAAPAPHGGGGHEEGPHKG